MAEFRLLSLCGVLTRGQRAKLCVGVFSCLAQPSSVYSFAFGLSPVDHGNSTRTIKLEGVMADKWTIEIEREMDGRWIAEIPSVPGAIAYGETVHDAIQNALAIAKNAPVEGE